MHATPLPTVCNTYSNHPRKITICLSLLFSFCLLHMRFSFRDAERQAVLKRPRVVTINGKETHSQCEQQRNPKFIPKFVCTTDTVTIHQRTRLGVLAVRRAKPGGSSLARRSMSMRTSAANRLTAHFWSHSQNKGSFFESGRGPRTKNKTFNLGLESSSLAKRCEDGPCRLNNSCPRFQLRVLYLPCTLGSAGWSIFS